MATPELLRNRVATLTGWASRDLAALWSQVKTAAEAREALGDVLPGLILTYGRAAAVLAADWYDDLRAKADVAGRFQAFPADLPDPGTQILISWGLSEAVSLDTAQSLIDGGVQKRITNAARGTVIGNTRADKAALGWQRVGIGECDWCAMLIGRGAVYTRETVDFATHDHCKCGAIPAFGGREIPVKPYTPSLRQSEADRERAKRWIAENL